MAIDPRLFQTSNVADTCGVWNILSSDRLSMAAFSAGCQFIITDFVNYECLLKTRRSERSNERELQSRLRKAQSEGKFRSFSCQIEDLQTMAILENQRRLGKGELSTIAFAIKYQQAVFTDDQKARRLASTVCPAVQTTPHLFSWLVFTRRLVDADKDIVISQHRALGRPLSTFFEEAYALALKFLLFEGSS
jgi:predicted nucleic acid-binding protein